MIIKFAQLDPAGTATLPRTHSEGAAGFDLAASEDITIYAGQSVKIPTGVCVAIPLGYVGLIRDRSSLHKQDLISMGGVIDPDYTGEIMVIIHNLHHHEPKHIRRGDRLAQLVVVACLTQYAHVEKLEPTIRGNKGFGSTG